MTLDRRTFLRRTSLALAGGLVLGDAALEAFERLTHRKVFALGGVSEVTNPSYWEGRYSIPDGGNEAVLVVTHPQWAAYPSESPRLTADLLRRMSERIARQTYERHDYSVISSA